MQELKIENIGKIYPNGVHALEGINLTIKPGIFGLLGPNGAGKSSLMRTIATLQEPDHGSISFNGIDVINQKERLRQSLGYLPQDFGVPPKVSAESLLNYFAVLKGISNKKQRKELVKNLLEQVNLFEARKRAVSSYSGGMKQRFGIAQALIGNPKLIIVDEPTAGLDPEERNRFHAILNKVADDKVIILSTHIVEDVSDLCYELAILNKGKIQLVGTPDELIDSIKGKIFTVDTNLIDYSKLPEEATKISSKVIRGRHKATYYSNEPLKGVFEYANPVLEDVYFSTINHRNN